MVDTMFRKKEVDRLEGATGSRIPFKVEDIEVDAVVETPKNVSDQNVEYLVLVTSTEVLSTVSRIFMTLATIKSENCK